MAWPFSAGETVLIITTIGGVIVSIMSARRGAVIEEKVDGVHEQTNSRMKRIEDELSSTRKELALALSASRKAESVRVDLAHEAARDVERREP